MPVLQYTKQEKLANDQCSSLFGTFLSYEESKVLWTLHFLCNLWMEPNKLECLSLARLSRLPLSTLAYRVHSLVCKKIKCCESSSASGHIHNISFSSKLTNQSNIPECCNTLSRKGLPVTNALAYWAHSRQVLWIQFHVLYSQHFIFSLTYELAQWTRVFVTGKSFQISEM